MLRLPSLPSQVFAFPPALFALPCNTFKAYPYSYYEVRKRQGNRCQLLCLLIHPLLFNKYLCPIVHVPVLNVLFQLTALTPILTLDDAIIIIVVD